MTCLDNQPYDSLILLEILEIETIMSFNDGSRHLINVMKITAGTLENGNDFLEIKLHIPENLFYFRGHFDGNPVLPGVVQLNSMALAQIESFWTDLGRLEKIRRLKFVQTIRPNDIIHMRLERKKEKKQVNMTILREAICCTSAILLFRSKDKL